MKFVKNNCTATTFIQNFGSVSKDQKDPPSLFPGRFALLWRSLIRLYIREVGCVGKETWWKFSIGRSTVHLPDKLFSLCLRIPAWIFRVPPSARIRLKSLFAPTCFSPSPALFPHLQPLRLSAFDAGEKKRKMCIASKTHPPSRFSILFREEEEEERWV